MKKIALILAGCLLLPAIAHADDATTPVKAVMDATVKNWSGADADWIDIFDESRLSSLYSKDFITRYKAAAANPAEDEDGISPFNYDVIVNGQDACPITDVKLAPQPPANGVTEVVVTFKKSSCMDDGTDKNQITTDRFEVIQQDGKWVIDDIITEGDPGQPPNHLKQTMDLIAKGQ
ncbi:hypothetical protein [Oryzifoliimicrobium ureilyticus]|uniref:hypothetical protein n=1 Tax=Oryzifoliimicrobium ureilyticus TaxID=3113724 RepID=UPI0030763221